MKFQGMIKMLKKVEIDSGKVNAFFDWLRTV